MCKELLDVILDPAKALKDAKEDKSYVKVFLAIVVASLISFTALLILTIPDMFKSGKPIGDVVLSLISSLILLLIAGFIGAFFWGFVVREIVSILDKKHALYSGVVSFAYPMLYVSPFYIILAIIFKIMGVIASNTSLLYADPSKTLSIAIPAAVLIAVGIYAIVTWMAYIFRALKEMFEIDYTTAIVVSLCIVFGYMLTIAVLWAFLLTTLIGRMLPMLTMMQYMSQARGFD